MGKIVGVRIARNGRVVLPKMVRDALGLPQGGTVVFSIDEGEITLTPIGQSVKRAQDLYRRHVSDDGAVDDFIADRRAEAARDDQG